MNSLKSIQKNRDILHNLISKEPLNTKKVYEQSCVVDRLILQYLLEKNNKNYGRVEV